MTTDATLTGKGHTTIPKEIRDSLNMKAGDRMTFTLIHDASADFADCLIGIRNKRLGCRATLSFNAKAAKLNGFLAT